MNLLLPKLLATPLLILAASLAGRRWGESVSGWFVGLPLTSGPVCLFLALEQGPSFATASTLGSISGVVAEAGFCLAYGAASRGFEWPGSVAAGSLAFLAAAAILDFAQPSLPMVVLAAAVALCLALAGLRREPDARLAVAAPRAWDIPARMAVATALVTTLTELAPVLGPRLSGIAATFPVFAAVLTAFAHRTRGRGAGIAVMRGLMIGLFGFSAFFVVLNRTLVQFGVATAFAAATLAGLAVQGASLCVSLWAMRRRTAV